MNIRISTLLAAGGLLAGCGGEPRVAAPDSDVTPTCDIPEEWIFVGAARDGIPALTNPSLVAPGESGTSYLRDTDRVMGVVVDGQAVAVPLRIQWWHEVVNLDIGDRHLAVTHCPLTGSSLVFDRGPAGDVTFGVSGLLYLNNLILYDRTEPESFWPQMARRATCGERTGTPLTMVASLETTWDSWRTMHPGTLVVSSFTDTPRDYRVYPYGGYDNLGNPDLLFPIPGSVDGRRLPKERVLGLPAGATSGIAFPFGELQAIGSLAVVETSVDGSEVVVFWDGRAQAAMGYYPEGPGGHLTFRVEGDRILDDATGSAWRIDGLAIEGPLAGASLQPVAEAFVSYWFAWALFHEEAELWTGA
jgi:hypothetical protein